MLCNKMAATFRHMFLVFFLFVTFVYGNQNAKERGKDVGSIDNLVKLLIKKVTQLSDHVKDQEIRTSRRIENLETLIHDRVINVEKKLAEKTQQQGIDFNQKITNLLTNLTAKADLEGKMVEKILHQEIDFNTRINNILSDLTYKADLDATLVSKIQRQEVAFNQKIVDVLSNLTSKVEKGEKTAEKIQHQEIEFNNKVMNALSDLEAKSDIVTKELTQQVPGKSVEHPAKSCNYLKTHKYLSNGYYYVQEEGKNATLQYCNMEYAPITTAAPTTPEVPTTVPVFTSTGSSNRTAATVTTTPADPTTSHVASFVYVGEGTARHYDHHMYTYDLDDVDECLEYCLAAHKRNPAYNGCHWMAWDYYCQVYKNARGLREANGYKYYKWM